MAAVVCACAARTLPSDVICAPDQADCDGTCAALYKDATNCGSCGDVCPQGTVCYDGSCATSCGGGTIQCGQSCVDPKVDRENCGACSAACPAGEACVSGACSSTCADGQTLCTLGNGDAYCAPTESDNKNCGGCGHACGPEEFCSGGACTSACSKSQTTCTSDGGAPYCASTDSDPNNCGACGHQCSSGEFCSAGTCTCLPGLTRCSGVCVDLMTDSNNCGVCDKLCTSWDLSHSPNAPYCTYGHCYGYVAGFGSVDAVLLDGADAYVADSVKGTITRVTPWSLAAGPVATNQGGPVRLAMDQNNIYWTNHASGEIMKLAKGGTTPTALATGQSSPKGIATDGTSVYWLTSDTSTPNLHMVPVSGGTVEPLAYTYPDAALTIDTKFDASHLYVSMMSLVQRCAVPQTYPMDCFDYGNGSNFNLVFGNSHAYSSFSKWVQQVDNYSGTLSSSTSPAYVAVVGSYLYWTDAIANGKVYVTDAFLGGTAQAYADVSGGQPGPLAADVNRLVWGTDAGRLYVLWR